MVGREAERRALEETLDEVVRTQLPRLVAYVGEAGIGKTRLAQEIASLSEQRGARVLWGWCYERQGAPLYWPWLQLIRPYVDETEAD